MTDHDVHHGHHPPHAADQHEGTHTGDAHDVHGMMIVGGETVYLSHLPMFGHPHHDIQAILEATLAGEGGDPRSVYVDDRERMGDGDVHPSAGTVRPFGVPLGVRSERRFGAASVPP